MRFTGVKCYAERRPLTMPELPEVETVRRDLRELRGETFSSCRVNLPRIVTTPGPRQFCRVLKGRTIRDVKRRGKYIIFSLDAGWEFIVHLGMTGALLFHTPLDPAAKHTHAVFLFESGRELRYVDPRQFGELAVVPAGQYAPLKSLARMGPEPLERSFTAGELAARLGTSGKVKAALMDQARIAGIGNIYSDEMLFRAGVNPLRPASSLRPAEVAALHKAMREVLRGAIARRGTSVDNFMDARGRPGRYQFHHMVYGKEGEPCRVCGAPIRRVKVSGRSSYYCPKCQPCGEEGHVR